MTAISTTGTLTAGSSKTFNLAPGSALSLTLSPNVRVTITETPESVSGSGVGGNTTRVHEPQLPGTFAYGPYAMGGGVVVAVASNSGSSVAWTRKDTVVTTNSDGTSLVSGDGIYNPLRPRSIRAGITLFGPEITYSAPATAVGANCTINSSGAVTVNGETYFLVNATATNTTNNWFEIQLNSVPTFTSDTLTHEYICDAPGNLTSVTAYMGTAGYSLFANAVKNVGSDGDGTSPFNNLGRISQTFVSADWTKSGYANANNLQAWVNAKLRCYVANGTTVNFWLRSIQVGVTVAPGRLAIVADDGYTSFLRLGVPLLEQYGLITSASLITDEIGNTAGGYASLADWQAYVSRGHECIAHGPLANSTNLFAAPLTTTALRIADMTTARDYLIANNLTGVYGRQCYIWPQSQYASTSGEADLLDAAQAAGFRLARAAVAGTATPSTRSQHIRSLSSLCHQRMTLPILGHLYAGVAATADDATETTNVNAIITAIQALATNGSDGVLMLHKVVGRGGATGGSGTIEIETDRLDAIAAATKTLVTAGTLRSVLFSDLI